MDTYDDMTYEDLLDRMAQTIEEDGWTQGAYHDAAVGYHSPHGGAHCMLGAAEVVLGYGRTNRCRVVEDSALRDLVCDAAQLLHPERVGKARRVLYGAVASAAAPWAQRGPRRLGIPNINDLVCERKRDAVTILEKARGIAGERGL